MQHYIESLIVHVLDELVVSGEFAPVETPEGFVERVRDRSYGDWACTIAMKLAKPLQKNPREIAEAIAARIATDENIAAVDVAGPGFINLTLSEKALWSEIITARQKGADFAKSDAGANQKINVEFISANPTGPMHVGHGRWAALGNALCNLLAHTGWRVTREFYINDAGHQMDVFGNSVVLRYLELVGEQITIPEEFYGGSYITDIAQSIYDQDGDSWQNADHEARLEHFREYAYQMMLGEIKALCARLDVHFDVWFSERTLYQPDESGKSPTERMLEKLKANGYLYEDEGATWFKSTAFGDDKNRVLIKTDGSYTYVCPDIAYHLDKMERAENGSEYLIDIWGADHHGYVARMQAAMAACGHPGNPRVLLGQLVNLFRDGEAVRMSKRTGEMVTFAELVDEVGADATKYLMLGRSSDQPIDFDIEAAKRADASNPVYYVQYAHARICSLIRKAADEGLTPDESAINLLTDSSELELARNFSRLAEVIDAAVRDLAPNRLTTYAEELAAAFHSFYTRCPVINENRELAAARLYLADATRNVLALVLQLLGVSAPERM